MTRSLGLLLWIALTGCTSQARENQTEASGAAAGILKEFSASLGAGDADRWLALWAEDGVQLPPDAPPVEGRNAIGSKIRGILDQFKFDMAIQNREIHTAGDWAFARGMYQATLTPKHGGPPIPIDGKYLTILKKQGDGSWKIYRDIFNSNVSPGK
jgi:uncharacterized protein (TIGR02246 family)